MGNIKTLGLAFGDETKGSFIDYLAEKHSDIVYFVKYNGGCQASHSVLLDNEVCFKFSQLSPGMKHTKNNTVLTSNFVINLDNLINEVSLFSKLTNVDVQEILNRVYIDLDCVCVTPLHKVYNIIDETFITKRGSVGTGVSIAGKWKGDEELTLTVQDLVDYYKSNENTVVKKLKNQYRKVKSILKIAKKDKMFNQKWVELTNLFNIDKMMDLGTYLEDIIYLLSVNTFNFLKIEEILSLNSCIFESSQGFLLDKEYGIYPNITYLDTTIHSLNKYNGKSYGFIRAYFTRHGQGVFPTEDLKLNTALNDINQETGLFNGKIRFGWLDCVLLKYALRENGIDELCMSCLDDLEKLKEVKICTAYKYNGVIDDVFEDIFQYSRVENNIIIIVSIHKNNKVLVNYLNKCEPIYETFQVNESNLDLTLLQYVSGIEQILKKPITLLSYGKHNFDKVERSSNVI